MPDRNISSIEAPFPQFGGHKWKLQTLSFPSTRSMGGSFSLSIIECKKCNYKMIAKLRYSLINNAIILEIEYVYDENETCDSFKMKQALS